MNSRVTKQLRGNGTRNFFCCFVCLEVLSLLCPRYLCWLQHFHRLAHLRTHLHWQFVMDQQLSGCEVERVHRRSLVVSERRSREVKNFWFACCEKPTIPLDVHGHKRSTATHTGMESQINQTCAWLRYTEAVSVVLETHQSGTNAPLQSMFTCSCFSAVRDNVSNLVRMQPRVRPFAKQRV